MTQKEETPRKIEPAKPAWRVKEDMKLVLLY